MHSSADLTSIELQHAQLTMWLSMAVIDAVVATHSGGRLMHWVNALQVLRTVDPVQQRMQVSKMYRASDFGSAGMQTNNQYQHMGKGGRTGGS